MLWTYTVAILATIALCSSSRADVALMLTDGERAALIAGLAAGLQAQPSLSPTTTYLLNKINTAPAITEHKDDKPKDEKEPAQ